MAVHNNLTRRDLRAQCSHGAGLDVRALCIEYQRLMELKAGHESGQFLDDAPVPEVTDEDVKELGQWVAAMLSSQGYVRWTQHKMAIKAMILNGFPPVRESPRIDRISDVLHVLAAHFEMVIRCELST